MRMLSLLSALLLGFALFASTASAQNDAIPDKVAEATLFSDVQEIVPGGHFWLAVHLDILEEWHAYWVNPGDSGMPTELRWSLPEGFIAEAIHWPAPHRIDYGGLTNFGYDEQATLLVPIAAPEQLSEQEYTIGLRADWLVCKDICIPENAELSITLPVAKGETATPSAEAERIEAALRQVPKPVELNATIALKEKIAELFIPWPEQVVDVTEAVFFPLKDGVLSNNDAGKWQASQEGIAISIRRGNRPLKDESLAGVLKLELANGDIQSYQLELQASQAAAPMVDTPPAEMEPMIASLGVALLFAFIGGLILNAMPCVLPILSLKALALARKSESEPGHARAMGIAYTFGVLACFGILAALILVLQGAGESVGWGFQLQSPPFILIVTLLIFLVGLNLSGVFELPGLMGNVGANISSREHASGSFFTGALAALVASPCTAPFMAPALGFALTQPPIAAVGITLSLGFGLAFPYLLISFVPRLYRALPKPGAWMVRLRQLLAFPMYATACWLLWVLVQQTGASGLKLAFIALGAAAFAAWWLSLTSRSWLRALILLAAAALCYMAVTQLKPVPMQIHAEAGKELYSAERLAELRSEGKPVFVYATAAWCITCKVNEQVALDTQEVQQTFAERGIVTMVADWTNADKAITDFLASFGRNGVPLYVYYAPGEQPVVLPQLLTPTTIIEKLGE